MIASVCVCVVEKQKLAQFNRGTPMPIWRAIGVSLVIAAVAAIILVTYFAFDNWRMHRPLRMTVDWVPTAYELAEQGKCKEAQELIVDVREARDRLAELVRTEFTLNKRCVSDWDPEYLAGQMSSALKSIEFDLKQVSETSREPPRETQYSYVAFMTQLDRNNYGRSWKTAHIYIKFLFTWATCYSEPVLGNPVDHTAIANIMSAYTDDIPERFRDLNDQRTICAKRIMKLVDLRRQYFQTSYSEYAHRSYLSDAEDLGSNRAKLERLVRNIEDGPRNLNLFWATDRTKKQTPKTETSKEVERRLAISVFELVRLADEEDYPPAQAKLAKYILHGPVKPNKPANAYFWGLTAQLGGATLSFDLEELERQLTEEEINTVKQKIERRRHARSTW